MAALQDLVQAGKVLYVGVSDTPAWKVAQANVIAQFRGWAPFIGLQIEYSLLERTVEHELVPMARELGLGITPWSPLKSGVLSGKYTRKSAGTVKSDRSAFMASSLNETTYKLIDELEMIARAHDTSVARVALAWVRQQPGVTSTIIGARRVGQLEDNLGSLVVSLTPEEVAHLNELSTPPAVFPQRMQSFFPAIHNGGTMVNGVQQPPSQFVMEKGGKPY